MATALLHLWDYVEAATRIEMQELAGDQLFEMARIAPQAEFLVALADGLDALDLEDQASQVRGWAGPGASPDVIQDAYQLSAACLKAAIQSNAPRAD